MFTDRIKVQFYAGRGGNGVVAWRREKYIPKGGPTGGNGGKGGSVILEASAQVSSLDWYRNRKILKAESGKPGGPNCMQGRNGLDLVVKVPCGTLIKDAETGEIIADMTADKEKFTLCKGGRGGKGNDHFKSPTNRAPNKFTEGTEGEIKEVELELKLIADVGLVGFPNAGKSTLINTLTHTKVKTAAYPFTTLQPNLGFITLKDHRRIYIADIPGIIEGAHQNRGLGYEFLRHIERTKLLIFMLDASGIDGRTPLSDWKVLKNEIKQYNPDMLERPFLVVLNKIDTDESAPLVEEFLEKARIPKKSILKISAITGEGLDSLVTSIIKILLS
jgi:GTP-binding protein